MGVAEHVWYKQALVGWKIKYVLKLVKLVAINKMSHLDANDLVFYSDHEKKIYSGGYSVNSILMKQQMSPIMTLNSGGGSGGGGAPQGGGDGSVADLFKDLVVPNWALALPSINHNPTVYGGGENSTHKPVYENAEQPMEDTLYNKLLKFVTANDESPPHHAKRPAAAAARPKRLTKKKRKVIIVPATSTASTTHSKTKKNSTGTK